MHTRVNTKPAQMYQKTSLYNTITHKSNSKKKKEKKNIRKEKKTKERN